MPPDLKQFWQLPPIAPLDPQLAAAMRARIDGKAKPPGSLGRIEDLAVQLGMIRHPGEPRGDNAGIPLEARDRSLRMLFFRMQSLIDPEVRSNQRQ